MISKPGVVNTLIVFVQDHGGIASIKSNISDSNSYLLRLYSYRDHGF